jgi:hypothetical protein
MLLMTRPQRYTDLAFPPYAYLPGALPHPTQDPQGHSYDPAGAPEPKVPAVDPANWRASEAYLFGCDLYNYGYWWEAHEAWEGPWRSCRRDELQAHFLQALIQVSARALKLRSGNRQGVILLGERSDRHMQFVLDRLDDPMYLGLDVPAWYERVRAYYDERLARPNERGRIEHDLAAFPYLSPGARAVERS